MKTSLLSSIGAWTLCPIIIFQFEQDSHTHFTNVIGVSSFILYFLNYRNSYPTPRWRYKFSNNLLNRLVVIHGVSWWSIIDEKWTIVCNMWRCSRPCPCYLRGLKRTVLGGYLFNLNLGRLTIISRRIILLQPSSKSVVAASRYHKAFQIDVFEPPNHTCISTKNLLKETEKINGAKESKISPIIITYKDYTTRWSKLKAGTISDPIGTDYAMYICTTQDEILMTFEILVLNIPYQTGYSPNR